MIEDVAGGTIDSFVPLARKSDTVTTGSSSPMINHDQCRRCTTRGSIEVFL
jgi:hypothetical protein